MEEEINETLRKIDMGEEIKPLLEDLWDKAYACGYQHDPRS
jgi:hypothetical protein